MSIPRSATKRRFWFSRLFCGWITFYLSELDDTPEILLKKRYNSSNPHRILIVDMIYQDRSVNVKCGLLCVIKGLRCFTSHRSQYSLLSPPPVRMNRIERSFFFLSSGFGGRGLEPWLRGTGSLLLEPIMVLVFLMGGAGGLSSTSPLSDIFS